MTPPNARLRGMSRSAMLAAGAAAVAATVACSGGTTDPADGGTSPTPTTTSTSEPDPGQPLYGAVPPEEDSGTTEDSGIVDPVDAGDDGAVAALYGAVPVRSHGN